MSDSALQPGAKLRNNRYIIRHQLKAGGFGAVYVAVDSTFGERLCVIKGSFGQTADDRHQFDQEAAILSTLSHPHLVRVTDSFTESDQSQYLVMEYIEGEDLEEMLVRSPGGLQESQVIAWIDQVLDALVYCHNFSPMIIHRDIKPSNIRIRRIDGKAILVDFGIAKIGDSSLKTHKGARAATDGYAPIEQYTFSGTGAFSDVYALGATLYHLLTGSPPPSSPDLLAGTMTLPAPRKLQPTISSQTEQVILRAMQSSIQNRYSSVAELRRDLRGVSTPSICPHCGAAVRRVARYCSNCSLTLEPLPLTFPRANIRARTISEMVRACDQHWQEACELLQRGEFESWLTILNAESLKIEAQNARIQFADDGNMALEQIMNAAAPARPKPVLRVQPTILDFGHVQRNDEKTLQVIVTNIGQGYLHGNVEAGPPKCTWIKSHPVGFDCLPGDLHSAQVTVETSALSGDATGIKYTGQILVESSGGKQIVNVILTVVENTAANRFSTTSTNVTSPIVQSPAPSLNLSSPINRLIAAAIRLSGVGVQVVSYVLLAVAIVLSCYLAMVGSMSGSSWIVEHSDYFQIPLNWLVAQWPWLTLMFFLLCLAFVERKAILDIGRRAVVLVRKNFTLFLVSLALLSFAISLLVTPQGKRILNSEPASIGFRVLQAHSAEIGVVLCCALLLVCLYAFRNRFFRMARTLGLRKNAITTHPNNAPTHGGTTILPQQLGTKLQRNVIPTVELGKLKSFAIAQEGGKYLLTGYGRFGGTTLVTEAMRLAREQIRKTKDSPDSLLVIRFDVTETEAVASGIPTSSFVPEFSVTINDVFVGDLYADSSSRTRSAARGQPKAGHFELPPEDVSSKPMVLQYRLSMPFHRSFPRDEPNPIRRITRRVITQLPRYSQRVDFWGLIRELDEYLEQSQGSMRLQELIGSILGSPHLPKRIVFVLDKITHLETLEMLAKMDIIANERVTVLAIARQEDVDLWANQDYRLKSIGFSAPQYIPCIWNSQDHIDKAVRDRLPNSEVPSDEKLKANFEVLKKHLLYKGRGTWGAIHDILSEPLYQGQESHEYIDLACLSNLEEMQHDAWLEEMLQLNWKGLLAGLRTKPNQKDRTRIGIYDLLDLIRNELEPDKFTQAQLIAEAKKADRCAIGSDDSVLKKVVIRLMLVLERNNYLRRIENGCYQRRWNLRYSPPEVTPKKVNLEQDQWEFAESCRIADREFRVCAFGVPAKQRRNKVQNPKQVLLCLSGTEEDQPDLTRQELSIRRAVERNAGKFVLDPMRNLSTTELRRLLEEKKYEIVYLAGHGDETGSYYCYGQEYREEILLLEGLAQWLEVAPSLECLILNTCSSADIFKISARIPCIIAVDGQINGEAATRYAEGFFDALGNGKSYREAHAGGKRAVGAEFRAIKLKDNYQYHQESGS